MDQKLEELRAAAGGRARSAAGDRDSRWFPIRGDQLVAGGFAVPQGLDRDDLNRRLAKILVDERRHGRPLDGLELLVAFRSTGGRILSVQSRRSGDAEWVRRFEAVTRGEGH